MPDTSSGSSIRFEVSPERVDLPLSERGEFGALVGSSVPMRATFALLERAARSDVTVLLEGVEEVLQRYLFVLCYKNFSHFFQPFHFQGLLARNPIY